MPVEISSCVILALKKSSIPDESDEGWDLETSVKSRLAVLFDEIGFDSTESMMFSLKGYDAEDWMSFYGVDVKELIDEYYILVSERSYYDSGGWEGKPPPHEKDLMKDPFYRFFHHEHYGAEDVILVSGELILVSSHLSSP